MGGSKLSSIKRTMLGITTPKSCGMPLGRSYPGLLWPQDVSVLALAATWHLVHVLLSSLFSWALPAWTWLACSCSEVVWYAPREVSPGSVWSQGVSVLALAAMWHLERFQTCHFSFLHRDYTITLVLASVPRNCTIWASSWGGFMLSLPRRCQVLSCGRLQPGSVKPSKLALHWAPLRSRAWQARHVFTLFSCFLQPLPLGLLCSRRRSYLCNLQRTHMLSFNFKVCRTYGCVLCAFPNSLANRGPKHLTVFIVKCYCLVLLSTRCTAQHTLAYVHHFHGLDLISSRRSLHGSLQ